MRWEDKNWCEHYQDNATIDCLEQTCESQISDVCSRFIWDTNNCQSISIRIPNDFQSISRRLPSDFQSTVYYFKSITNRFPNDWKTLFNRLTSICQSIVLLSQGQRSCKTPFVIEIKSGSWIKSLDHFIFLLQMTSSRC